MSLTVQSRTFYLSSISNLSNFLILQSVVKLMGRIVPISMSSENDKNKSQEQALALHDHTYGITSDPLTQFSCIFSALIHDVDHHGVSNTQLVREADPIAQLHNGNSVLEQNSVVVAWTLLMEPRFQALRATLCATRSEAKRFRQLVVNAVMATDIMTPDLKAARNMRWRKAFSKDPLLEDPSVTINRKATIVIDHMIQASDVCHTMQHWHVYRKWNERLFTEMTKAYNEGRSDENPADTWYKGEIGFFDYYIIPLAKKLADCGVFGVSSDEYLNYAIKNRDEWEARGEEVVREMVERMKSNPEYKSN
jgi:3'5'-cyclic nucleotide phosphodiesterase